MSKSLSLTIVGVLLLSTIGFISAQQSISLLNVYVTWANRGTQTDFVVTSPLSTGINLNDSWIALGINIVPQMVIF